MFFFGTPSGFGTLGDVSLDRRGRIASMRQTQSQYVSLCPACYPSGSAARMLQRTRWAVGCDSEQSRSIPDSQSDMNCLIGRTVYYSDPRTPER
ncbi:hypothetical protein NJ7G_2032 [Natrinema sp. J7-2]|nr:hypothetical protein NJ7G_2032 [Natrinema sp. J7-2]